MASFLSDLKYALRAFRQRPGFTAVLVLTLALGIGSNAAIFSVADAVLFEPLPYKDPGRLVLVWNRLPTTNVARGLVSGPDFLDYRRETTRFEGFAGAFALNATITGDGTQAEEVMVGWTTANLFEVLGVHPILGRDFDAEDEAPLDPELFSDPNAKFPPGAVMLAHGIWKRRFGSDPKVIGKSLQIDGQESIVIGILPPDFRIYLPEDAGMPTDIDAWRAIPSNLAANESARDAEWLTVVARLKPGVTVEQAQAEMDALAARLRERFQHHADAKMQIALNSMHKDVVSHARPVLLALLGAVGFVLLIACANVANLLLVRASSREREISVRAALGGGRGRIIRQMLTESSVLAVAGGTVGLALAWLGGKLLTALRPGNLPRFENVEIDMSVLLFTAGATIAATLIFGLVPALNASRTNLADALKDRGSSSGGMRGNRIRTVMVVAEVGLSFVLLIGAGLMFKSLANLKSVRPGYNAENVLTFTVPIPLFKYRQGEERINFFRELGRRLEDLPGVQSVGAVSPLPLAGGEQYSVGSYGLPESTDQEWSSNKADYRAVLPGYMKTLDIDLVAGRYLTPSDNRPGGHDIVVIDETLAHKLWPGKEAVGRQFLVERFDFEKFGMVRVPVQVVGVVKHIRAVSLAAEGREALYFPYSFFPWFPLNFTVQTASNPGGLVNLVRREVGLIDRDVPISNVRLMEEYVADAMAPTKFALTLITIFAGLALVLASIGLYGVISYSVRQRTREIGVRIAFGARENNIVRLVVGQGMRMAVLGVGAGLIAAFFLTQLVTSLLYGVRAADPITFVAISFVLLTVATAASYLPARRATRVDPIEALRDE